LAYETNNQAAKMMVVFQRESCNVLLHRFACHGVLSSNWDPFPEFSMVPPLTLSGFNLVLSPSPDVPLSPKSRTVRCRNRVGGLLKFLLPSRLIL
jgi:hypothetical protein